MGIVNQHFYKKMESVRIELKFLQARHWPQSQASQYVGPIIAPIFILGKETLGGWNRRARSPGGSRGPELSRFKSVKISAVTITAERGPLVCKDPPFPSRTLKNSFSFCALVRSLQTRKYALWPSRGSRPSCKKQHKVLEQEMKLSRQNANLPCGRLGLDS